MRAIVQRAYGPPGEVLSLQTVRKPEVGIDEVLVKVLASTVAGDDWHLTRGVPYIARLTTGLRKPKSTVPGLELAGYVEAVGENVALFKPGDEVFGWSQGALAEYVSIPQDQIAFKPPNLSFEEAAGVPISGFTALQGLRDSGQIQRGQKVLINGASGGVGSFAVQIAKSFGAHVTGVAGTRNLELLRSIGADRVIDYRQEDFTRTGDRYDLILDMAGKHSLSETRRALTADGTLVMVGGSGGRWLNGTDRWLKGLILSPFVRQRLRPLIHNDSKDDLIVLKQLIEDGKITPIVSARYSLAEVPDAIAHLHHGHSYGKVVITV